MNKQQRETAARRRNLLRVPAASTWLPVRVQTSVAKSFLGGECCDHLAGAQSVLVGEHHDTLVEWSTACQTERTPCTYRTFRSSIEE